MDVGDSGRRVRISTVGEREGGVLMAEPRDRIDAVTDTVVVVGGRFMNDPITKQRGTSLGFKGSAFGFGGRAGVLGDVGAEVVASVLAFFDPSVVERW
jgi:hypothetical protein